MIKRLFLICSCFFFFACPPKDDGLACTEEYVYGLSITVKDGNTGLFITENSTLIAKDGNYTEELMGFPESTNFVGAGERPGTYSIYISAEGYQAFTSEEIQVMGDECHVIPEARTFELLPL